jgi:DNA-binding transcriptional ArsR family regulator
MSDALSLTFAALADPTRRSLLARLAQGEATVTELAAPFSITLPSISRHLKVLERAGLITKGRSAQWRPCRLEVAQLQEADAWLATYRALWDARLDRLDEHLAKVIADGAAEPPRPRRAPDRRGATDDRPPGR